MAAKTRSARTTRTSRRPPRKRSGATGRLRKRSAKAVAPDVVQAALAAFAHEVRTPLTGILAISDLLATSDLGERERRWADTIKAGAEHLASLATLFVDAARTELSTPAKTTPKPTTAMLIVASHTLPDSKVARHTRTEHAPPSAT